MAKFKVILSDPEDGKSKNVDLEGNQAAPLIGRKIGETIDGTILGLRGYRLQITGGSDKDGFPMRPDVHGGTRVAPILGGGVGFRGRGGGRRSRKTVRGSTITETIHQINMKITEKPEHKERKAGVE